MRNLGKTYISRLMRVVGASVAVVLALGHERGGRLAREKVHGRRPRARCGDQRNDKRALHGMGRTMMGRRRVWGLFAVGLAVASFVASAPALGAAPTAQDFTDWTAVSGAPAVATGTLHGQAVTLSGTHVFAPPVSVVDGHWTFFSGRTSRRRWRAPT